MVFLKTNPHCACQFICENLAAIGIGVTRALREPPHAAIWASVILCRVMNTGAKIVFMATDTESATQNLPIENPAALKSETALA